MTRGDKFTTGQVITALEMTQGMVHLAADALHCSHQTIYNYAKKYKCVQAAIDHNRGTMLDTAELALRSAILAGEHWAIAFALRTLGKDRGYVERQEQEQVGPVVLRVVREGVKPSGANPNGAPPGIAPEPTEDQGSSR